MKRYMKAIFTLSALLAVLLGTVWLGRPDRHQRAPHVTESLAAPVVETTHPIRRSLYLRLKWFGRVESKRTVRIISLAAGKITAVKVADGALVRRGDVLFTLGGPQVERRLYILEQRIKALERRKSLMKGLVQMRREAVAKRLAKKEELFSAKEHLAQIEGNLGAARKELAAFRAALLIHAPMDGIFVNRKVSPGQDVTEGAHLADVISTDLRIIAYLFPPAGVELLGKTGVIQTAQGGEITGKLTKMLPQRTAEGATVVWLEGKEIENALKPGEQVSGRLVLEIRKGVLAVPQDAVVRDEQEHAFVFVKKARGYQKKAVKIGLEDGGWCEIVSGISDSDEVVVRGAYELFYRDFKKAYKVAD